MMTEENSFKKMDRTIHRVICEKLGDPNKVLFMLLHSDESTIEDCTVHIARKLLRPSRKANIWRRLCCFLSSNRHSNASESTFKDLLTTFGSVSLWLVK
ncbi:unnamed protein product [Tetraodon nigroviridis]|uniref:(spotted green pufferfish) hypothetical protein n=1 Tax=Tetraodon nigroviridis TaxID=99883 RepID=Q4SPP7_TETNG|nr:unnamed protein product [Tetraodon nigroviridis]